MRLALAVALLAAVFACTLAAADKSLFLRGRKLNQPYKWNAADLAKIPVQNFASNPFEHSGYFTVNETAGANMYAKFF